MMNADDADDERRPPLPDRVLPERGAHVALLDHLDRHRKRARAEHEGEFLRLQQRRARRELDLRPPAQRLPDDRVALHAIVEHDRHVLPDVARRRALEHPRPAPRRLERHQRLVERRVARRRSRVLQQVARDQRLGVEHVERDVGAAARPDLLGAPMDRDPARNRRAHAVKLEPARHRGLVFRGDEILTGNPPLPQKPAQRPQRGGIRRRRVARVVRPLVPRVSRVPLRILRIRGLRLRAWVRRVLTRVLCVITRPVVGPRALVAALLGGVGGGAEDLAQIHLRLGLERDDLQVLGADLVHDRAVEPVERVDELLTVRDDLELHERGLGRDPLRLVGIVDARKFDDDAVAGALDRGLADAELVDPVADRRQRALDGVVQLIALKGALRVEDLDREVHAALQVQPQLERPHLLGFARRLVHHGLRHQGEAADRKQDGDPDQPPPYRAKHLNRHRRRGSRETRAAARDSEPRSRPAASP